MKKTKIIVHLEMYVDGELSEKKLNRLNIELNEGANYIKSVVIDRTKGRAAGDVRVEMGVVDSEESKKSKTEAFVSNLVEGLKGMGIKAEAIKVPFSREEKHGATDECNCIGCTLTRLLEAKFGKSGKLLKELNEAMSDARQIGKTMAAFHPQNVDRDPAALADTIQGVETDLAALLKADSLLEQLPEEYKKDEKIYASNREYVAKVIQLSRAILEELKGLQRKADEKPPEATN